jgi:hypothetical protein
VKSHDRDIGGGLGSWTGEYFGGAAGASLASRLERQPVENEMVGWLLVGVTCAVVLYFIAHESWANSIGIGIVIAFVSVIGTISRRESRRAR